MLSFQAFWVHGIRLLLLSVSNPKASTLTLVIEIQHFWVFAHARGCCWVCLALKRSLRVPVAQWGMKQRIRTKHFDGALRGRGGITRQRALARYTATILGLSGDDLRLLHYACHPEPCQKLSLNPKP